MSTPNCGDFCSAEKCEEILRRIEALEAELLTHKNQKIPEAHNYTPVVDVNTSIFDGVLEIDLTVEGKSDSARAVLSDANAVIVETDLKDKDLTIEVKVGDQRHSSTITLPVPKELSLNAELVENNLNIKAKLDDLEGKAEVDFSLFKPEVTLDISPLESNKFLFKSGVNGASAEATLDLNELNKSNLKIDGSFQSDTLNLTVADGESFASTNITIPLSDLKQEHVKSNLSINGSFQSNVLNLTVADGESFASTNISIPRSSGGGGSGEHIPSALSGTATYQENKLTISIADGESQTAFQVEIETMDKETKRKIEKIYHILGGDNWETTKDNTVTLPLEPEKLIKKVGNVLYQENSDSLTELTVTNILELFTAFSTVDFYRSGHHRLPATTVTSLLNTEKGNKQLKLYDALSFQEWNSRQLDALVGEFPLKLKFKTLNNEDKEEEQEICIENISEGIAEFVAMMLTVLEDSDNAVNIGMKTLVEASKACNAATVAVDYAFANAQHLGYKANQVEKEVDLTFTPGATNLRLALKPSTQKIVGWKNEDPETLVELIKKTLIGTEIVKASLFHPFDPDTSSITGDAIKENIEEQQATDDSQWESFKNKTNNPSGRYNIPKPKAKIRDLTIDSSTTF